MDRNDEAVIGVLPEMVARAKKSSWQHTSYEYRASIIEAFGKLFAERVDGEILSRETGKPISQSKGEAKATLARIDFFLNATAEAIADETVHSDAERGLDEVISYDPHGVIANISAWNYPYFVGANVFIPALLTGNRVLYKPSEYCIETGAQIVELMHAAGLPEDAMQLVAGGGGVGEALLGCDIDAVFFTGSLATGKRIARKVADKLIPVQLELGGKDPVYICEDVDVAAVAAGTADGAFYNNGQSCCSVERIYVHKDVFDEFCASFVKAAKGFVIGDPRAEDTYIGRLCRPEHTEFLQAQVDNALERGARLLCGGTSPRSGYFEPTVLVDVNHEMDVMRHETFGPVIGIMKVGDDREAIELMNDTHFGLTAGVFTSARDRAESILRELDSGSAYWNCCDRVSPHLPWSGRRQSGIGQTLSHLGIRAFVQPRAWHWRQP